MILLLSSNQHVFYALMAALIIGTGAQLSIKFLERRYPGKKGLLLGAVSFVVWMYGGLFLYFYVVIRYFTAAALP